MLATATSDRLNRLTGYPARVSRVPVACPADGGRTGPVAFALFVLLNATLFLRPGEVVPALDGAQVYLAVILACAATALPAVLRQLGPRALAARPVTFCVVGLLGATVLAGLANFNLYDARSGGFEFAKLVVYYLLLVGVVDTPARLRRLLFGLAAFMVGLCLLTLLHHAEVIHVPSLVSADLQFDEETGLPLEAFDRLYSTGIFNDPNDLALILLVGMVVCLFALTAPGGGVGRFLAVAPLALFAYAFSLTKSRGGLIALLVALLVLFRYRYGWKRTAVLSAVVLPAVLALFAGRQTDISTDAGTAQDRMHLWSDGLAMFRSAPLFGVGPNEFAEQAGLVAHNSFLHAFAELGMVGGTLFLAAFLWPATALARLGRSAERSGDDELDRFRPYLTALLAGYGAGLLFLSRVMVPPTYLVLGLAAAYLALRASDPALRDFRVSVRRLALAAGAGVGFLACLYVFVRAFVQWGVAL